MHSMNYLGKVISNFRYAYNEINAATLTGAIDVVVVEQPDGSYSCSPFHVRFGKIGVLRSKEKVVDIEINGEPVDIHMKLGESGEAFFVEEVAPGEEGIDEFIPPHLACSPIPTESTFADRFSAEIAKADQWSFDVHRDSVERDAQGNECDEEEEDEERSAEKGPIVVLAGGNLPKTFKAETLGSAADKSQVARKLSTVSGDFRPIAETDDVTDDFRPIAAETDDVKQSASTTDLTLDEPPLSASSSLPSNKRKRRKKSLMKKKNNHTNSSSTPSSSFNANNSKKLIGAIEKSVEVSDTIVNQPVDADSIFQIEDIEQNGGSTIQKEREDFNPCDNEGELSRIQNTPQDLHFFSDTEVTPGCRGLLMDELTAAKDGDASFEVLSAEDLLKAAAAAAAAVAANSAASFPHDARQYTPVQSDTEFETKRMLTSAENENCKGSDDPPQQSWRWGELPTSSHDDSVKPDDAQRSVLYNMLGFMKRTKQQRRGTQGMYLSDINSIEDLDPEVAALYFPNIYTKPIKQHSINSGGGSGSGNDEDAESGNGPSLPQSPHSVEGAIGGPKSLDSDFEEPKHGLFNSKEIALSLCGGLEGQEGPSDQMFQDHIVHFEEFVDNPGLLENPNLVVKIDGKNYKWRTACSILIARLVFNKSLPEDVISRLSDASPRQDKRKGQRRDYYRSWFTWGVRASDPVIPGGKDAIKDQAENSLDILEATNIDNKILPQESVIESKASSVTEAPQETGSDVIGVPDQEPAVIGEQAPTALSVVDSPTQKSSLTTIPVVPRSTKPRPGEQVYSTSSESDSELDRRQRVSKTPSLSIPLDRTHRSGSTDKFKKTLRLSSDLIAKLNLREGANEVEFSVTTAYQGTSRCKCFLFKWRYDDKIVISDIDGTITKSDVLGHILPIVGKDWAQSGVAKLFTKIKNNGYKLLYLSARAIGQARLTRDYLRSIKQEDLSLPEGPILLNPTSLLTAFHTEVIEKKPEEFKISCLRDIQALFPPSSCPFYAGYGNKINDVWAYQAVGIPIFRIFTINHKGELKHELTQTFQSSYSNMSYIVDQMFPAAPVRANLEDFSQFSFWREPLPDIDIQNDLIQPHK
ncbi:phosphatidate phosphatase LPIN1 isoform X3 [Nilaparvata lugens]|nr:phosphatidate phosphatase LPIN1 isoform X3 [Nilaparvata lugens]XP_022202189.2 phosphatidate phosphatase LPIN1 isoform X3 [Nilaparvata lugens]XP_022202190.2 phosphatidate phosphatase LPIN1 isoform X3 [Nilaparvata lugens]XP_022202191.2 phosphatidate phosphatase LPIN1 isoform X3 [Nilaparvata lugens]